MLRYVTSRPTHTQWSFPHSRGTAILIGWRLTTFGDSSANSSSERTRVHSAKGTLREKLQTAQLGLHGSLQKTLKCGFLIPID